LLSPSFCGADLSGANLSDANLNGVDAAGTDLENANLTEVNLTDANIGGDAFGGGAATVEGADLAGATQTGIGSGDIDGGPAVLPPHWMFAGGYLLAPTAYLEYEGALQGLDLAGIDLASARVSPKSGATLSKSARHFAAELRLANPATGAAITGAAARALAARHDVRVILAGPKIKTATVTCGWSSEGQYFSCTFTTPGAAKTGKRYRYTLTAQVNQGPGFLLALPARGVANPETIHFR
jgi:Pentapeptide repeats (8 copies)